MEVKWVSRNKGVRMRDRSGVGNNNSRGMQMRKKISTKSFGLAPVEQETLPRSYGKNVQLCAEKRTETPRKNCCGCEKSATIG